MTDLRRSDATMRRLDGRGGRFDSPLFQWDARADLVL
jgi:hypothetical protein